MTPILEVRSLSKQFRSGGVLHRSRLHAVDDVTFALQPGRITALAGESGSGKSTVARLLLRLLAPSEGEVLFEGRSVAGDRRRRDVLRYRSQVQMIFQDPFGSLNPAKTVRAHLERPVKIHSAIGRREVKARVDELLEIVGLVPAASVADKYPHELSGGQRQRVAIARALAANPKVVIADEPISMLDVSIRVGILNLMRDLKKLDIAFLYVTHDLASARYVADDILVMYAGQIVEQGPVDEVLARPLHPYTRLLIASVPDGERRLEPIEIRKGTAAAAVDPKPGCRFVDRCPLAIDRCRHETPELAVPLQPPASLLARSAASTRVEAEPGRIARCHVTAPRQREDLHAQPAA